MAAVTGGGARLATMKPKRRRLYLVGLGMLALAGAAALVLTAFEDSLVFFYSPTDVVEKQIPTERRIRLGGLVAEGSVARQGAGVTFVITDGANTISVAFNGILPDLFREGQGVVAEGKLTAAGGFAASTVLAKHDETYMPAEVADALKRSGQWRGEDGQGAPQ